MPVTIFSYSVLCIVRDGPTILAQFLFKCIFLLCMKTHFYCLKSHHCRGEMIYVVGRVHVSGVRNSQACFMGTVGPVFYKEETYGWPCGCGQEAEGLVMKLRLITSKCLFT